MEQEIIETNNQPKTYKVIPIMGLLCFPNINISFVVGKEESKQVVMDALKTGEEIIISPMLQNSIGEDFFASVNSIGTVCVVKSITPDKKENVLRTVVLGIRQVKITSLISSNPCYECEAKDIVINTENSIAIFLFFKPCSI